MRLHSCTHFVQVKLGTVWDTGINGHNEAKDS